LLERRARPLVAIWRHGLFVDLLETLLTVPLLSVLLIAADENAPLAVIAMATLLAALLIAQRSRATTDLLIAQRSQATTEAALAAEQANARRDQLTGARNRRAFEEAMVAEHARIVRGATAAGLFVVDLDRFKFVNDRFGHSVGDEVLIEVFRRLGDGLRPADVVARWGGEEIAILAPAVRTGKQLEQFGERIRMLIGGCPIATSTMAISLTASVGGTLLDGSVPAETAFQQADGALYEAKRTRDTSVTTLPPPLGLRLETG
jgi:diguanylate cyclase (GGDEF)-like protein